MSKAFTRETDDLPERPVLKRHSPSLPPGAKNYFTSHGLNNLRRELEALASSPSPSSVRDRILEIQQRIESAVVVPPPPQPWNHVLFGATVTVRHASGEDNTYRIVGVDETDSDRDWISWLSPLAKALLKARVGDHVRFRAPAGEQNMEIISIRYE